MLIAQCENTIKLIWQLLKIEFINIDINLIIKLFLKSFIKTRLIAIKMLNSSFRNRLHKLIVYYYCTKKYIYISKQ